jgi:hypothetical protein
MPRNSLSAGALIILSGLLLLTSARGDEPLQGLHFGTWGFDIPGENAAVKPGDDFFEFANGGWLARTAIPADKMGMSVDVLINNRTEVAISLKNSTRAMSPRIWRGRLVPFTVPLWMRIALSHAAARPSNPH